MRHEAVVTSVSWIPSEAVEGIMKLPFDAGVGHYDDPLPDVLTDLEELRVNDRFRFANELRAWIEVDDDGRITDAGYAGGGHIGATTVTVGRMSRTIAAFGFDDIQHEPEVRDGSVRFVQTAGARTGSPMPRRVRGRPYVRMTAPTAWTTLALTLNADGTHTHELVGASVFPRHWVYDNDGRLVAKSGLLDMRNWMLDAFGEKTPWGAQDSPALVTAVETALERQLSSVIMRGGAKPRVRRLEEGELLTEQGQPGSELFLLLDGVLRVEVDGEELADVGPGAVVGERALLEGGTRTSTLRAVTPCKVAVAAPDDMDPDVLAELSAGHRREDPSDEET